MPRGNTHALIKVLSVCVCVCVCVKSCLGRIAEYSKYGATEKLTLKYRVRQNRIFCSILPLKKVWGWGNPNCTGMKLYCYQ